MPVKGRAETPEERERVLDELGRLWNVPPDMRLGQLVYNAVGYWLLENNRPAGARHIADAVFYLEDDDLLTTVAKFVTEQYPPKAATSA